MVGGAAVGLAAGMATAATPTPSSRDQPYRVAIGIVSFLGLYQGAVALAGRVLFDADQRLAPALWLPAPWWWIACLAISAVALVLVVVLDGARRRALGPSGAEDRAPVPAPAADKAQGYDAVSAVVFLVGLYNGLAPFASRLVFDGDLLLALPLRLGAPWWWITSLAVLVVTFVLLTLIDQAKDRALATAPDADGD
jgi:hypothetical protein